VKKCLWWKRLKSKVMRKCVNCHLKPIIYCFDYLYLVSLSLSLRTVEQWFNSRFSVYKRKCGGARCFFFFFYRNELIFLLNYCKLPALSPLKCRGESNLFDESYFSYEKQHILILSVSHRGFDICSSNGGSKTILLPGHIH